MTTQMSASSSEGSTPLCTPTSGGSRARRAVSRRGLLALALASSPRGFFVGLALLALELVAERANLLLEAVIVKFQGPPVRE